MHRRQRYRPVAIAEPRAFCTVLIALLAGVGTFLYPAHVYGQRAGVTQDELVGVDLMNKLGAQLPLSGQFTDEAGTPVTLSDYFDGSTPVLVTFVYYSCPMLCSLVLDELSTKLQELEFSPGDAFRVVTVSIAPEDTPEMAARAKAKYVGRLDNDDAGLGWHFLTGDVESIEQLTDAAGFKFKWIEEAGEYAHASALLFASGTGRLTRVMDGLGYQGKDVRRALVEASNGTVGSPLDRVLLYCFQFDPTSNAYVVHALNLMKLAGGVTILVLSIFMIRLFRGERHRARQAAVA